MNLKKLWNEFIKQDGVNVSSIKHIPYGKMALFLVVDKGWDKYFIAGSHWPFTIHHAFMEGFNWFILVSGTNYLKDKWLKRVAAVIGRGTQAKDIFPIDNKEEYNDILENCRKADGAMVTFQRNRAT